ncbi:protein kinase domain-containing protein, partial [Cellulomonas citrea]|uniref:protein kinase domain-containing protein n=1 Tax=Cellulomonas citrea TaxID=1909423 RepID=UPI001358F4CF
AALGALDGLAHLHGLGLAHHDVSPGNLLVPDQGGRPCWAQVRLTDLGAPVEVEGHVVVSPHYVAPEVARGLAGDARADLYALAATLVHLLTGAPPYEHDDPDLVLAAHVNDPVVTPSARVPGLPPALDEVVRTALAKHPADRFPDAEAMRAALRAVRFEPGPGGLAVPAPRRLVRVADGRTRPLRSTAAEPGVARTEPAVTTAPTHLSGGADRAVHPVPPAPARAVPVGALLLVLVAVGAATGVALIRPAAPAVVPTVLVSSPAAPSAVASPSAPTVGPPVSVAVVPDVVGAVLADAGARLAAVGLVTGDVQVQDGPATAGTVLASRPAAGSTAPVGSAVQLDVASGWTAVPSLEGLDPATAAARLAAAGLLADGMPATATETTTVTGSWPAATSRVEVGTVVRVVLARALVDPPTPTPSASPPAGPSLAPTAGPSPTLAPTPGPSTR